MDTEYRSCSTFSGVPRSRNKEQKSSETDRARERAMFLEMWSHKACTAVCSICIIAAQTFCSAPYWHEDHRRGEGKHHLSPHLWQWIEWIEWIEDQMYQRTELTQSWHTTFLLCWEGVFSVTEVRLAIVRVQQVRAFAPSLGDLHRRTTPQQVSLG